MIQTASRLAFRFATVAAALIFLVFPASAQIAKAKKQEAASGVQSTTGSVPLRVGLVISEATRTYKTTIMLTRVEFGRRLADKAVKIFNETFVTVRQMPDLPVDPHAYDGLDLLVVVEVPTGRVQTPMFSPATFTLNARFTVLNSRRQQILQVQETDSEQARSPAQGPDQAGESVVRRFIQELILNPTVRAMLSPAPVPTPEARPVLADTAAMDSSGLDVPPPPPWTLPASSTGPPTTGVVSAGRP